MIILTDQLFYQHGKSGVFGDGGLDTANYATRKESFDLHYLEHKFGWPSTEYLLHDI